MEDNFWHNALSSIFHNQDKEASVERSLLFALLDSLPHPVFVKDLRSRYLAGNAAFLRLVGLPDAKKLARATDHKMPWRHLATQLEAEEKLLTSGLVPDFPRELDFDGHRLMLSRKVLGLGPGTEALGLLGSLAVAAAADPPGADFARQLAQVLPLPALAYDARGQIVAWNASCQNVTGMAAPEQLEAFLGLAEFDGRQPLPSLDELTHLGAAPREFATVLHVPGNPDGLLSWTALADHSRPGQPLFWVIGRQPIFATSSGQDLMAMNRELEQRVEERTLELKIAKERAEESDRLKTAFLSNMSHEIRTPMNAIIGFANLLDDDHLLPEQKRLYIQYINTSSNSLLNLLNDIINIAQIEAEQIELERKPFDLGTMFEQIYHTYRHEVDRLKGGKVALMLDVAPGQPLVLNSDRERLVQVLTHLLNNALKFTDSGTIEFGYTLLSRELVQIYVRDTGIGIPETKLDMIFGQFNKVDGRADKLYGGAGLGLSICKKIVGLLKGEIWAESIPGKGSIFYFTHPLHDEVSKRFVPAPAPALDLSGKTILVAEDVDVNFFYLEELLADSQAKILWAKDGRQAVEMCLRKKIDLVLMDVQMPVMNGYEATRRIKEALPDLPIIIETAYATKSEQERSMAIGADDYVAKPIHQATLMRKIAKLMEGR